MPMSPRTQVPVAALAAILCWGCTSDADEASPEPTLVSAQVSSAAVTEADDNEQDEPAQDPSDFLPDGVTAADLPAEVDERSRLVTEWIDANMSESSGFSLSLDQPVDFQFSVDVADRDEAETLCGTFKQVVAAYLTDKETGMVSIEGWIVGEDGVFASTEWEPFTCS